jgi:glutamate-1-semialdehyde aminotransferase
MASMLRHDHTVMALGDGGAHYGLICDASYTTHALTYWTRDRQGERWPLAWTVQQLGCRAEYWFRATPPRNGGEAAAAVFGELDRYMHLCALNRGILMTPFHNMALFCPAVTEVDVDRHTEVFRESVTAIL